MSSTKKRVFMGMSGGVDSSVAALLLKKRGYDVTGVFMRCWSGDGPDASVGVNCTAERDAEDARRVAEHIGIPFYIFNFEEEYKRRVVAYMVEGYRAGITPNPDVMCNREIKFGLFFKKVMALGADCIATGHYARVKKDGKEYALIAGKDKNKDQSYFLWTLTQKELAHTLFPIGRYLKSEVRALARKAELPTAEKKDSQGICFLGDVSFTDFLKTYLPQEKGAVFNIEGEKIGEHKGAHFYTIGQRHGFSVQRAKGKVQSRGETKPLYVAVKDVATNTVIVAEGSDDPALYKKELTLTNVNFIRPIPNSQFPITVHARVRYRQPLVEGKLVMSNGQLVGRRTGNQLPVTHYRLLFDTLVKFVAPGQSAVMYVENVNHSTGSGLELLAGGVIQ